MPLFRQWKIDADAVAAIWKVEEPTSFFEQKTGLASTINNEKRRTEHLAGRFLLRLLQPDFPIHLIAKDEQEKPRIPGDAFHFSISHSWPWVAVVIDRAKPAGIDIQTWHPRITDIQHKYLSAEEQLLVGDDDKRITLAWCAKESAYKWNGIRGVEFIEELPIQLFTHTENPYIEIYFNSNKIEQLIVIKSILLTEFACCYIDRVDNLGTIK